MSILCYVSLSGYAQLCHGLQLSVSLTRYHTGVGVVGRLQTGRVGRQIVRQGIRRHRREAGKKYRRG